MTTGERYASIAANCSTRELAIVWDALLFGRRGSLDERLSSIAIELDALRAKVWTVNVARSSERASICTDPDGRVQPEGVV